MSLAKELKMTLAELDERMTQRELRLWMAYAEWERKEMSHAG